MEAEDFLELVYGDRRGWIDLPAKVGGYWVPYHSLWEGECGLEISRRIDSALKDGENLYFSVGMFRKRGRNFEDLLPSHWLWADLDEVHPSEASKERLTPSVAWESSRGRYQALWALDRKISPETLDKLSQALSYHLGADRGGWDRTQVLRIVGTRNFKYPESPEVKIMWVDPSLIYDPRKVWEQVRRSAKLPVSTEGSEGGGGADQPGPLPARAKALLRVPADAVVDGERSTRLWELECLLAEAGWGEDAIYKVVSESAWNKWSRVRTGETRLRREIRKALGHVRRKTSSPARDDGGDRGRRDTSSSEEPGEVDLGETSDEDGEDEVLPPSPFIRYASFMAMGLEAPRWMVEDIWTQGAHGLIGGEPKTLKSTLAMAMGLSVASGAPFLGKYAVHTSGPVLMLQEENAPWMMQDKMRKIARSYGLISSRDFEVMDAPEGTLGKEVVRLEFPSEIPLRLLNNYGFDLGDDEHRELLEREVVDTKPVLIILDPLYLMFGGADYDKARDIYPFLKWLMRIRYEYNCAICLIHHFRKQSQHGPVVRPGQRVLGSTTFHAWAESAMYCEFLEEGEGFSRVKIEREFRNVAPQKPWELRVEMGPPGDLAFEAQVTEWNLVGRIEGIVSGDPGVTANQIAEILGIDKRTVLSRVRGSETMIVERGKKGRGHSHRLYLAGSNGDEEQDD